MLGPGKYDDLCTEIRHRTGAKGVILVIANGNNGSGLSAQIDEDIVLSMPEVLREVADHIDGGQKTVS